MKRFAELLDSLVLTPQRHGKLRLVEDYLASTGDPERGWTIAALTRALDIPSVKPAQLRELISTRMDSELFAYAYDYVGDLAETIALSWPEPAGRPTLANDAPGLTEVVETLLSASRRQGPALVEAFLDRLDSSGRFALLKLVTGGFRIGLSARLAKQALANHGGKDVTDIEELWHGLEPPYTALFDWLENRADKPENLTPAPFRPVMLAHPLEEDDLAKLDPAQFLAEWKWDGIRVQAVAAHGEGRLYTRTGDDISAAFPDLASRFSFHGALDGELLVARPVGNGVETGSFSDLQQRLNRRSVPKKLIQDYPAFFRAYDLLDDTGTDLRDLAFETRRERLERFVRTLDPERFDCSPLLEFSDWDQLAAHREAPPLAVIEGVMIKRRSAPYVPGRPKGEWYKWKRNPFLVDAVLMYAQRGHGKRSGFYSDYTFGVWTRTGELVPVGKAYSGFTDDELKRIDKFVRDNTVERFGPVRSVRADADRGLVLEIAFEGLARSSRHKSGVAMRFPRVSRLRWDKPAGEAGTLSELEKLISET